MIINITPQDLWNEFVYYRKNGKTKLAFEHIRREGTPERWEAVIAGIVYYRRNPQIGDIVRFSGSELEFMWDEDADRVFKTL